MKRSPPQRRLARPLILFVVAVPALAHGASGPKKLPVCDGKHLREVNIYGSVLPGSPILGVVAAPALPPIPLIKLPVGGTPPPPVPQPAPAKTSARNVPLNYGSC